MKATRSVSEGECFKQRGLKHQVSEAPALAVASGYNNKLSEGITHVE